MTTIHDVARACGVSVSTVSRAFTAPHLLQASTRTLVLQAALHLDYRPNRAAQALVTGRTGTLAVVVPDLANPFFPGLIKAAQAAARAAGVSLLVADTDEDPVAEAELIATTAKQTDGVVVCSSRLTNSQLEELSRSVRLVCVNRAVHGVPAVLMDSGAGVRRAVAHLAQLGHRRCLYINGPKRSWSNRERRAALLQAAAEHGLHVVQGAPVVPTFEAGMELAADVSAGDCTAVVAYNDLVALGLTAGLRRRGRDVPESLSVVGVDDVVMASMGVPPLTTVRMPVADAGRQAVELLLEALDAGRGPARRIHLDTELVLRGTTASPATR